MGAHQTSRALASENVQQQCPSMTSEQKMTERAKPYAVEAKNSKIEAANFIPIKKISRPSQQQSVKANDVAKIIDRSKKVQARSRKAPSQMAAAGREPPSN